MTIEILGNQKRTVWKMTTATGQWSFRLTALISQDMRKPRTMRGSDNTRLILVS